MRTFLESLYTTLSRPSSMFFLKALGIICVSTFTFIQWVLPLYWERQTNFDFTFQSFDDGSIVRAQPYVGFNGNCLVWGTLQIENKSKSPLHIKNTHMAFLSYDVKTCPNGADKCVAVVNHPTVLDQKKPLIEYDMSELMEDFHSTTIPPVTQTHDLFPGGKATRPFVVAIPILDIQKDRLTVVAAQEYGNWFCETITEEKWYLPQCKITRVIAHVPSPCT